MSKVIVTKAALLRNGLFWSKMSWQRVAKARS